MLNLGSIAGKSPDHDPPLHPGVRTEKPPTSLGQPEVGRVHTHLKGREWQCAQVVIEQLGTVRKSRVSITDQPIKVRTIAGTSRSQQGIDGGSDSVQP